MARSCVDILQKVQSSPLVGLGCSRGLLSVWPASSSGRKNEGLTEVVDDDGPCTAHVDEPPEVCSIGLCLNDHLLGDKLIVNQILCPGPQLLKVPHHPVHCPSFAARGGGICGAVWGEVGSEA